ncbi:MAG TPA: hypothetical protein VN887_19100 [Candidatus Angelobacter sp.]|nr:hypothetical protein [Candidatus Angelobacter sp.]
MNKWFCFFAMGCAVAVNLTAQGTRILYQNDFQKADTGKVPDDFLVLDGRFAVKEEEGNKFLELPGAPLDTFGVLFGPTEKEGITVSARAFGTNKGRRYPTFAVGLNGQGSAAYRLQVSPAKKAVELYRGDEVKASLPFEWRSGTWTTLRLRVRKVTDGDWSVEGKVWVDGGKEPGAWMVTFDEKEQPVAGKASIWASPYATTPVRFDDLLVTSASEKP